MLGPFGETLVLDWGVAKVPGATGHSQFVGDGIAAGFAQLLGRFDGNDGRLDQWACRSHMERPEMAEGLTDQVDQKSDIYLLGATLYEILTGKPPRSGKNALELLTLARTQMLQYVAAARWWPTWSGPWKPSV